jgi:hypothetical protein
MKKSVLVIALAFGVSGAFAQDLTSKKGEPILPEAGDWAISMNADPIFHYVGNAFNGNSNNANPNTSWLGTTQTIIGKKFIDEKNAYRLMFRLGMVNETFKNMVSDNSVTTPAPFPEAPAMVEDKFKMSRTNIAIGVGKEMRRGKTRLQGYYGADVMIWLAMSSDKYSYGNELTVANPAPTSTSWDATTGAVTGTSGLTTRNVKSKQGMTFGLGVRGFIGAEYFIFPKIGIGAEYGWGIGYQMSGKGKSSTETVGGATPAPGTTETVISGSSKFGFDTDMNGVSSFGFLGNAGEASLKVSFHF